MTLQDARPTERFTSRVDDYVRFRPGYPKEIITLLRERIGLSERWTIADIGSGPGNLTRLFLDNGNTVVGVEPNDAMRHAGDRQLADYSTFSSVRGSAESTTLAPSCVDLVVAGQAFHWFDPGSARIEIQRISRHPGWVALVWNKRPEGTFSILDEYSELLRLHSPEYSQVRLRDDRAGEGIQVLFAGAKVEEFSLENLQEMDEASFWGRMLSSSYTPLPGEPGHEEIKQGSAEIFARHETDGLLKFPYETKIFIGRVFE